MFFFYRRFFLKVKLPISDELRKELGHRIKTPPYPEPAAGLFDQAQAQIAHLINNTTYPNFLKSDMYVQYVQVSTMQKLIIIFFLMNCNIILACTQYINLIRI